MKGGHESEVESILFFDWLSAEISLTTPCLTAIMIGIEQKGFINFSDDDALLCTSEYPGPLPYTAPINED